MVECTAHAQCGGWVHFACEQLSEEEIEQVVQEADEHPYICCLCREHGAESDDGESENSDVKMMKMKMKISTELSLYFPRS